MKQVPLTRKLIMENVQVERVFEQRDHLLQQAIVLRERAGLSAFSTQGLVRPLEQDLAADIADVDQLIWDFAHTP